MSSLTEFQLRCVLTIQASMISDAATMPLHWIYDQSVIADKVQPDHAADATFFPTPSCPFYTYPFGVLSPYGDESLPLLHSLASAGKFDHEHAAQTMFDFFSTYPQEDGGEKGYAGRLNHAPKSFVEARQEGKSWEEAAQEDSQANGMAKVPLLVARYAGRKNAAGVNEELESAIAKMVGILQKPAISVQSSILVGKIIEHVILSPKTSPRQALEHVFAHADRFALDNFQRKVLQFILSEDKLRQFVGMSEALASAPPDASDPYRLMRIKGPILGKFMESLDIEKAVKEASLKESDRAFVDSHYSQGKCVLAEGTEIPILKLASSIGLSCALPGALLVSLLIAARSANLREALHFNVLAGGDSCSRALVIGALYGAQGGAGVIPADWEGKVHAETWTKIKRWSEKVAQDNEA